MRIQLNNKQRKSLVTSSQRIEIQLPVSRIQAAGRFPENLIETACFQDAHVHSEKVNIKEAIDEEKKKKIKKKKEKRK